MTAIAPLADIALTDGVAYAHTKPEGKCTAVLFDFICIPREQRPAGHELADRISALGAERCFAAGRRNTIHTGCGPTVWSLTVPNGDVQTVVDALTDLARGDSAAAETLLATWSA